MATRKGMGQGKGKGYKNIIGKDPMVHSQSAKGRKQPQKIPQSMAKNKKEKDITDFKEGTFHTVIVNVNDEKQIQQATEILGKYFEDFQNKNIPFNFQGTVIDSEGNEANFLVDFSSEDYDEGDSYVASVTGKTKEGKPFDDWCDIEAFVQATEIVECGVTSLDANNQDIEWDTGGTDLFIPEKGKFDAIIPIFYKDL